MQNQMNTRNKTKPTYASQLQNFYSSLTEDKDNPENEKPKPIEPSNQKSNNEQTESINDKVWITRTKSKNHLNTNKQPLRNQKLNTTTRNERHVTTQDIEAMKRWFVENWTTVKVIPYEILTLESFLMTYFFYTIEEIELIKQKKQRKFGVLKSRYILFLSEVANVVQKELFSYEMLHPFMKMCERNFNKVKAYNPIIQSFIHETRFIRMGYLVDESTAYKMQLAGRKDIKIVEPKTKLHTIFSWLQLGKYVHIPESTRKGLNLEADFDVATSIDTLPTHYTGYGNYVYSDIKHTPLGTDTPESLGWFSALNNQFKTQPLLTEAPAIHNYETQPHKTLLTYDTPNGKQSIEVYMMVDWAFYSEYKNHSGIINIQVSRDVVLINSNPYPMKPEDINQFTLELVMACHKMTGERIKGDLAVVSIRIGLAMSKMGSFLSKLDAARKRFLLETKDVYKVAVVASKASGKTTIINTIRAQLGNNIYVEDSDDYGRFVSFVTTKYGDGNIERLNTTLTEAQIIADAELYASTASLDPTGLPSFYNSVVGHLIQEDVKCHNFSNMRDVEATLSFTKLVNNLYIKYHPSIRDLVYKLDSGDVLNQKNYENGILRHMASTNTRILLEFFHIFASYYRRSAANFTMRYEPNFDTDISLFARIRNSDKDITDSIAEILLKMFYDQSAEHVTSVSGPADLMTHFGLIPVLTVHGGLHFKFDNYGENHGAGDGSTPLSS